MLALLLRSWLNPCSMGDFTRHTGEQTRMKVSSDLNGWVCSVFPELFFLHWVGCVQKQPCGLKWNDWNCVHICPFVRRWSSPGNQSKFIPTINHGSSNLRNISFIQGDVMQQRELTKPIRKELKLASVRVRTNLNPCWALAVHALPMTVMQSKKKESTFNWANVLDLANDLNIF